MVDDLPAGPFDVVLVAYNTLFNLEPPSASGPASRGRRAARARRALRRRGVRARRPAATGTVVSRALDAADEVVLSISEHDPATQRADGQFVEFADGERVRLRPWSIRYAAPAELDAMAAAAGFARRRTVEDFDRQPFDADSPQHVTVYALQQVTFGRRRGARFALRSPPRCLS